MNLCDCELSHNGLGRSGRECDCPAGDGARPWDTERALRVALFEFYSTAHETWANIDARRAVEGITQFERPSGKQYRESLK